MMQSLDLQVLSDALAWHQAGHAVQLVTVVQTWGSAPRPVGAMLALRGDGQLSGSVSGGCVEDDLIARARQGSVNLTHGDAPAPALPAFVSYGVSQDEAARFGLPCGGTLRLLLEPLSDSTWITELLHRTQNHELVARTVELATGLVRLSPGARGHALKVDAQQLCSVFGPAWRLLLIGAGQLSQAVAQIALMLDFEVLVCDPRPEYAWGLDSPASGVRRLAGMPDDVVRDMRPDAHTAIVALTHDPKLDDMALLEALQSDAFYVGALGSRRNQAARKERLSRHFGLTPPQLARLHGPVGLALGGKSPAEIALSVMAHIVQTKHGANRAVLG